jgi:hypothetical protein
LSLWRCLRNLTIDDSNYFHKNGWMQTSGFPCRGSGNVLPRISKVMFIPWHFVLGLS